MVSSGFPGSTYLSIQRFGPLNSPCLEGRFHKNGCSVRLCSRVAIVEEGFFSPEMRFTQLPQAPPPYVVSRCAVTGKDNTVDIAMATMDLSFIDLDLWCLVASASRLVGNLQDCLFAVQHLLQETASGAPIVIPSVFDRDPSVCP